MDTISTDPVVAAQEVVYLTSSFGPGVVTCSGLFRQPVTKVTGTLMSSAWLVLSLLLLFQEQRELKKPYTREPLVDA